LRHPDSFIQLTIFVQAELNAPQDIITCARKSFSATAYLSPLPQCISMSSFEFGLVTSIFTVGGLLGALLCGPWVTTYGRLQTMCYTTGFFTLGPIAEACAPNVAVLAVGRFISGLGAGASVVVVPIYISEVAPPNKRGFFGSFTQIMINMGILIAQLLGLFLSHGQFWRVILGVGGIIGLNQLAGLLFATESPKWTAEKGAVVRAKKDLQRIRGQDQDIQDEVETWGLDGSQRPGKHLKYRISRKHILTELLRYSRGRRSSGKRGSVVSAQRLVQWHYGISREPRGYRNLSCPSSPQVQTGYSRSYGRYGGAAILWY